jgi:hypothetical protein
MLRTQDLFSDGEGSLVERFGLRILALPRIEIRQVVETGCGIRMLRTQDLFTVGEGTLVERFGYFVLNLIG